MSIFPSGNDISHHLNQDVLCFKLVFCHSPTSARMDIETPIGKISNSVHVRMKVLHFVVHVGPIGSL